MSKKGINKHFLFITILSCLFFVMVVISSSDAEARLTVELNSSYGPGALGESVPLSGATCEYCLITPDPFSIPIYCEDCGDDVAWVWMIIPPQSDAMYNLDFANTPNPVFTGYTVGRYDVSVIVCNNEECSSDYGAFIDVYDPIVECPLPDRTLPIVIYDPPSESGLEYECLLDSDGNGLNDNIEQQIAQCFVPEFRFDVAETWFSLGPEEPRTVFNIALDGVADDGSLHIIIRYGMVWGYDAGFVNSDDPICHNPFGIGDPQAHAGDTQGMVVTAWLRKRDGRPQWYAEIEYISGFQDYSGVFWSPAATISGTHPKVYPSAGKHHFRPSPDRYYYDIAGGGSCVDDAYGNSTPYVVPTVEHLPHFPHTALQALQAPTGPRGGPPTFVNTDGRVVWANACSVIKGDTNIIEAGSLRPVDLSDWTYPRCWIDSIPVPYAYYPAGCTVGDWANYLQWPCSDLRLCPAITDSFFWNDDLPVSGVWSLVSGDFSTDIDGDGLPFWDDPCPVSTPDHTVDSDNDGVCDAIDVCPRDPTDDADRDGYCGLPPTCNAGGPYSIACNGTTTFVTLNGLSSVDPDGFPLTYSWSTDCPGDFDNADSGTPILEVPFPDCSIGCNLFLTVTDEAGTSANCLSTVTISDTTPPDISCAANLSLECSNSTLPLHTGFPTVSDMCTSSPVITHSDNIALGLCEHEWTINRIWTAVDNCDNSSNCEQTIDVADTTAPVITCPADITISCEESTNPENTGSATADDNCDVAPSIIYSNSASNLSCPADDMITRTWTTVDACGNTSGCNQIITVEDTIAPVIACNAPPTIIPPDAPVSFIATATDNCDTEPIVEITEYDCFTYTQKGKRISKLDSCEVQLTNSEITILDSEGVDTTFTWNVRATDCANNQSTEQCTVLVKNPAK